MDVVSVVWPCVTGQCVGDNALLSHYPLAHDHSLVTTSRHSTTHELALWRLIILSG